MLEGPSLELYKKIIQECSSSSDGQSIKLIASGGVSSLEDVNNLKDLGCEGVIIGKALYEGHIQLRDLERYI
jgi:phosphoribosylformimino-5-aminoimidazole carboxamide ribotide isomerase